MESVVSVSKCRSYEPDAVYKAVKESLANLGAIETLIKKQSRVLIKPNLLSARLPEEGITTHPEVVRAVIKIVHELGAAAFVGDSPAGSTKVSEVYEKTGIKQVCDEEGANIIVFDKFRRVSNFFISEEFFKADVVISVPKFKTHNLTTLTGAVKNMFGVIPGHYKAECHKHSPNFKEFSRLLADFYKTCPPHLAIVDAVVSMAGDGPVHGRLVNTGMIIAGFDAVAVDAVLALIMQKAPQEVLHLRHIYEKKLGQIDLKCITIIGIDKQGLRRKDFKAGDILWIYRLPSGLLKFLAKFLCIGPKIEQKNCRMCGACIESCPMQAIETSGNTVRINKAKCIFCLCCCEFCPYGAIRARKI